MESIGLPYSLLTAVKLAEKDTFQALYYHDKSHAIYTVVFKDDLLGAVMFNRFLAQMKKKNPGPIRFCNNAEHPFRTPGIEVYFRFNFEYFEQNEESENALEII